MSLFYITNEINELIVNTYFTYFILS